MSFAFLNRLSFTISILYDFSNFSAVQKVLKSLFSVHRALRFDFERCSKFFPEPAQDFPLIYLVNNWALCEVFTTMYCSNTFVFSSNFSISSSDMLANQDDTISPFDENTLMTSDFLDLFLQDVSFS